MNTLASVVARLVSGRIELADFAAESLTPAEIAAIKEVAAAFRTSPGELAIRLRKAAAASDWPAFESQSSAELRA